MGSKMTLVASALGYTRIQDIIYIYPIKKRTKSNGAQTHRLKWHLSNGQIATLLCSSKIWKLMTPPLLVQDMEINDTA